MTRPTIDFKFATRDDCLDRMVPSDLRTLIRERDNLKALRDPWRTDLENAPKGVEVWLWIGDDNLPDYNTSVNGFGDGQGSFHYPNGAWVKGVTRWQPITPPKGERP